MVVGVVLCLVFLGEVTGIREGTIITAMVAGKLVGWVKKWLSPVIQKICFGE